MMTFSPVLRLCVGSVKMYVLDDGLPVTAYSFTELVTPSDIKIFAEYSVPFPTKYNLSFTCAPTRYPCVRIGGTSSSEVNP